MPHQWEVNLFSAEIFTENNYAYFRNTSLQHLLRNTERVVAVTDITPERPAPADAIVQDFFDRNRRMRGVLHTRTTGPGFAFRFGEKNVLGLTTAVRADLTSYRIPAVLRYPLVSELKRGETLDINAFSVETMSWGEIGLHYSRYETEQGFAWGISPKLVMGFVGGFMQSESAFQYTPSGGDTAIVGNPTWTYGLSGAILDENWEKGSRIGGWGFGSDIGVTKVVADDDGGYIWRAGASLLDIGFVRFSRGSEQHRIAFADIRNVDGAEIKADDARGYLRELSAATLGDSLASLQANSFFMGLPTALSLQADARLTRGVYVGGIWTQRVPIFRHSIKRPTTLAVVPRWEHRWASVSLPVVLNDWQSLRVGLAARLGWLYLGTDNLGSFTQKEKLSGTDAYIGLKINGFSLRFGGDGSGLRKDRGRSPKQNRRKIKCYEF
jgi:hypothetical protein